MTRELTTGRDAPGHVLAISLAAKVAQLTVRNDSQINKFTM